MAWYYSILCCILFLTDRIFLELEISGKFKMHIECHLCKIHLLFSFYCAQLLYDVRVPFELPYMDFATGVSVKRIQTRHLECRHAACSAS